MKNNAQNLRKIRTAKYRAILTKYGPLVSYKDSSKGDVTKAFYQYFMKMKMDFPDDKPTL